MNAKELKEKFEAYTQLRFELLKVCQDYVEKTNMRPEETFNDFFLKDNDEVGLTFLNDEFELSLVYTSVKIEDLIGNEHE